jgi:glycosyltransferase involved in cell wall biosynthesis
MPKLTIQLCTYKRANLLGRVLEALFDQTLPDDAYEVVLVNDGSPDETAEVIERARPLARCAFTVITQENSGLAKGRNAGIARSRGERICFIDDDVLPTPVFAAEHLASDAKHGDVIVRGAVINTESFDDLPLPIWTPANYSGNYFWTSNVSVRRARLDRAGGRFDDTFAEYGWEDIELGMRFRELHTRATFNRFAVAFHHKPRPRGTNVAGMLRQVRAQARTAVQLRAKHPHWRVDLAIGTTRPQRALAAALRGSGLARALEPFVGDGASEQRLSPLQRLAAGVLATDAYYDELFQQIH